MKCMVGIGFSVKIETIGGNQNLRPFKEHENDAAYDIRNAEENAVILKPGERKLFSAGFRMELPEGFEAQIRPRSGNALKKGITVLNSPGTIDSNYRGIVGVILYNASQEEVTINPGDKIAQMVINELPEVRLEFVDFISKETERGEGGFGSTGTVGK